MLWKNQLVTYKYLNIYAVLLISLPCIAMLGGCMVGPDYQSPQSKTTSGWLGSNGQQTAVSEQNLIYWWTSFDDPALTSLIDRAVKNNLNLQQAQARIRQARASRGIAASAFWPSADLSGSVSRSRSSAGVKRNLFQSGLDAIWEVDIFGGIRRGIEAADADIKTAIEDRRDVLVTLTAEVALNYIDLRGFQQQIVVARENLEAQKSSAAITRKRFQSGFVGALDVANANAQVAATASQIPVLESSARQIIYNLSVLLALEPAALLDELSPTSTIPVAPPTVPLGVPSDLLRRRPDIRRAESQIHAATARIGVATADLFPKLSLSASTSLQGNNFNSLSNWDNRTWSYGPSAQWQIFSAGAVRSNIELQKALKEETFILYQQTVLAAMQEVENALIASTKEEEHRKSLAEAVAANRKAVELSTILYTEGETDFLNVLNAQRSLYLSQDALVQSNRTVSTNLVVLYKALGGGWSDEPAHTAK